MFYVLSSPEKLDRIGDYLAQKVSRDIHRHKNGYVVIAMEAMDQLLQACHAQCLNLFVESFLKMVQRLLECQDAELQLMATLSFVKFANIEEDTPSYHRRYDFFVSKFSALCHSSHSDASTRTQLRLAGLKGLQGVVRKTVSDDLQANIWDDMHMEKIVPSLLFNMQDHMAQPTETPDSPQEENYPWTLAEMCLRQLTGRATFGHILSVLGPVFRHLDSHQLWVPNDFAVHVFKIIMYSIQAQYSFSVIQALMNHMDDISKSGLAKVLAGMVDALSHIVAIAATESIGPSVLDIFNSLLNHLRRSIETKAKNEAVLRDEQLFQEAVINALGEFANNLPDYQKIEIMMFILNKVPPPMEYQQKTDALLQRILLKSLLKVGTKYRTVQMSQAFPSSFIQPLLKMSLAPDTDVRLLVQFIFHTLLDRHENLQNLKTPSVMKFPQLTVEKCSRQDTMFMKKNGAEILYHIFENVQIASNREEHFNAIYTSMALLCLELGSEEALMELLRLIIAIQDMAITSTHFTAEHKAHLHSMVASFLYLVGHLTAIPALCSHIDLVTKRRSEEAPYLLPRCSFNGDSDETDGAAATETEPKEFVENELLFDRSAIAEALQSTGHETAKLMQPFVPRNSNSVGEVTVTRSISDLNAINVEVDSVNSSPGLTRRQPEEEITIDSLKKLIVDPAHLRPEQQNERRQQVIERFRTAPFEELMAKTQETVDLQNRLNEIFGKLTCLPDPFSSRPSSPLTPQRDDAVTPQPYVTGVNLHAMQTPLPPPVYPIKFPELFVF